MTMPRWSPILLMCLAITLPSRGDDGTDRQIAMTFYPTRLDADFRENHSPSVSPTQIATPLRVDLDHTGNADYLAVIYSNGFTAALRVIKGNSLQTAMLVIESGDQTMGGRGRPALYATDIDNDGTPELVVEFSRATWIYQYHTDSCTLTLFGPTRATPSGPTSDLGEVSFVDVDGDGVLEIIERGLPTAGVTDPDQPIVHAPYTVNKVTPGGTTTPTEIRPVFFDRFSMADATESIPQPPSQIQTRSFSAAPGDYTLRIVNGDQKGYYAVSSVEIRLNGVTILSSANVTQTRILTFPVTLLDSNNLTVEIRNDPSSQLSIVIARGL
jgi:hypothetical protein